MADCRFVCDVWVVPSRSCRRRPHLALRRRTLRRTPRRGLCGGVAHALRDRRRNSPPRSLASTRCCSNGQKLCLSKSDRAGKKTGVADIILKSVSTEEGKSGSLAYVRNFRCLNRRIAHTSRIDRRNLLHLPGLPLPRAPIRTSYFLEK